jgi:aspartyl-tRNA(Asn)/glutamyl-tRNA(Gln) amidotransferase subunit A
MQRNLLPFLTIGEASKLIQAKKISPVELVESFLERIHRFNGDFNSYITICSEEAVKDAQRLEKEISKGVYRGPLHGIPIAVKDQLKTKGIRTTNGSRVFSDYFPEEDATVISKLKEAGFVLLGKLNLSEFAIGGTRLHPYGTPRNPWDLTRNPGESSSGSAAAVAASLCCAAIGEDTGGSIRWPASWCGAVGLRPTAGRVSRHAIFSLCWSMDTAGPITKTTEGAAIRSKRRIKPERASS